MRIRRSACLILFLPLLIAAGCGRVHQVYWAHDDFNDPDEPGFLYDRLYLAPDAAAQIAGKTVNVEVADPTLTLAPEQSKITKPIDWREWQKLFEGMLADKLHQSGVFKDVSAAHDDYPIKEPDLIFRAALTEFHEGNAFLRYMPGFGAGATRFQWEGELLRAKAAPGEDARLFAFADARLHPGGPMVFLSTRPWNGQVLLAEDQRFALRELVYSLRKLTGTTTPLLPDLFPHPKSGPGRMPEPPPQAAPVKPASPLKATIIQRRPGATTPQQPAQPAQPRPAPTPRPVAPLKVKPAPVPTPRPAPQATPTPTPTPRPSPTPTPTPRPAPPSIPPGPPVTTPPITR